MQVAFKQEFEWKDEGTASYLEPVGGRHQAYAIAYVAYGSWQVWKNLTDVNAVQTGPCASNAEGKLAAERALNAIN